MNKIWKKLRKMFATLVFLLLLSSPGVSVFAEPIPPTAPVYPNATAKAGDGSKTDPVTSSVDSTAVNPDANSLGSSTEPVSGDVHPVNSTQENTSSSNNTPTNEVSNENSNSTAESSVTEVSNSNTGSDSVNNSDVSEKNDKKVDINNDADVQNGVNLNTNTGENNSDYNTGNGSVKTGDANIVLNILNLINSNFLVTEDGQVVFIFKNIYGDLNGDYIIDPKTGEVYDLNGSRVDPQNINTGAGSSNTSLLNTNNGTSLTTNNNGNVDNKINLDANTGNNSSSYNTGNGNVETGDVNVSLNLMNFLNTNVVSTNGGLIGIINIFGNWLGNLLLPKSLFTAGGTDQTDATALNSNTGASSESIAKDSINNLIDVNNDNQADIGNQIIVDGNTGNNESDYNTGNGTVSTGDSNTKVNLINEANTNVFGDYVYLAFINVLGTWTGKNLIAPFIAMLGNSGTSDSKNISASNNNTGADSRNQADVTNNSNTNVTNNNLATIFNNIFITTNTGNNSASYNTGSGSVSSGDSNVLANIANFANLNLFSKKFVILFINVFGDWTGNVDFVSDEKRAAAIPINFSPNSDQITEESGVSNQANNNSDSGLLGVSKNFIRNIGTGVKGAASSNSNHSNKNNSFSVPSEKDQVVVLADYLANHLNIILFGLLVIYLSFLSAYFKGRKSRIK